MKLLQIAKVKEAFFKYGKQMLVPGEAVPVLRTYSDVLFVIDFELILS